MNPVAPPSGYRQLITDDIRVYIRGMRAGRIDHATEVFLCCLEQRQNVDSGILALAGHALCRGINQHHVVPAGRALVMLDAYVDMVSSGQELPAALAGMHAAQALLANISGQPQLKTNVLSITNRSVGLFVRGDNAYRIANPLHVGMVLAGGNCRATDAITPFALYSARGEVLVARQALEATASMWPPELTAFLLDFSRAWRLSNRMHK